ncbi:MAG: hypothetical protein ACE5KI_04090, partial [Dehalococcoidia bacterium]
MLRSHFIDWFRFLAYNFLQRLRATWLLLAIAAFAVLASVTMVITAFLYSEVQAEAGLKHTIASTSDTSIHTQIVTQGRPLGPTDYDRLQTTVEVEIGEHIGGLYQSQQRLGRAQRLPFVNRPEDGLSFLSPLAVFTFRTDLVENTRLVEGRRPQILPSRGTNLELEVSVGADAAETMGWGVDTTIYVVPFFDDQTEQMEVHVVGLIEPANPRDIYWMGDISDFTTDLDNNRQVVPLLLPEELFFQQLGSTYPFFTGSLWWTVFLDVDQITPGMVESTQSQLEKLEADINKQFARSLVITGL